MLCPAWINAKKRALSCGGTCLLVPKKNLHKHLCNSCKDNTPMLRSETTEGTHDHISSCTLVGITHGNVG